MSKDLTTAQTTAFESTPAFESAQRMAQALCSSSLVPAQYQGKENLGNALIALEIAQRQGASPLMVMQNLHIIHGRPAWSSTYVISAINACGRFSPLRFQMDGEGMGRSCTAWCFERSTGERLDGPTVSMQMAKAEGWYGKKSSKWATMPELMLRYRAAAFFGRLYAPELLMGLQTPEEVRDVVVKEETTPITIESLTAPATPPQTPQEATSGYVETEPAPAPKDEAGAPTTDDIADMVAKAKTEDELALAEDLIGTVESADERKALMAGLAKKRKALQ